MNSKMDYKSEKEMLLSLREALANATAAMEQVTDNIEMLELVDQDCYLRVNEIKCKENLEVYAPYADGLELNQAVYVIEKKHIYAQCPMCGGATTLVVLTEHATGANREVKCPKCSNGRVGKDVYSPAERVISGIEVTFNNNGSTKTRYNTVRSGVQFVDLCLGRGAEVPYPRKDIFLTEDECNRAIEQIVLRSK